MTTFTEVVPEGSRIYLFNAGSAAIAVPIRCSWNNGTVTTDTVFVQPGGKPYLPDGWEIDPVFLASPPRYFKTQIIDTTSGD